MENKALKICANCLHWHNQNQPLKKNERFEFKIAGLELGYCDFFANFLKTYSQVKETKTKRFLGAIKKTVKKPVIKILNEDPHTVENFWCGGWKDKTGK